MTFDEIRAAHPAMGLTLYAIEPGQPVTLEVIADGEIFTFHAETEAAVLARAFPPPEQIAEPDPPEPPENVFD
ncbi:hypothetical protein OEG84_11585 [Hoeflea sp. G2-23]|uniref:Uncharacterized protein n=1 Tax=Hoeflea algicola TaxID=2983763 RepID=A0ABT3Z975_9HYPH|nr:hypothetical protein [Hoeflea algicola]MCY0148335.1 hypothetical protein [Hoeflea algicola]